MRVLLHVFFKHAVFYHTIEWQHIYITNYKVPLVDWRTSVLGQARTSKFAAFHSCCFSCYLHLFSHFVYIFWIKSNFSLQHFAAALKYFGIFIIRVFAARFAICYAVAPGGHHMRRTKRSILYFSMISSSLSCVHSLLREEVSVWAAVLHGDAVAFAAHAVS